jgi:hypothetical protein
MTASSTWVGLDVHARSTHAAAIERESDELRRARFGTGTDEVVAWLEALPQPVHACYEAGPHRRCPVPCRSRGGCRDRRRRPDEDATGGIAPVARNPWPVWRPIRTLISTPSGHL